MMLRTSLRDVNPAFNMFKFSVRKNIGLILLLSAAALVFSPGYTFTFISDYIERFGAYPLHDMLTAFTGIMAAVASVAVVIFNIINFMFLYSKKSGDVFHSLPLKRGELLLSRAGAGIASALIPMSLAFLGLCFMLAIPGVKGSIFSILMGYFYAVVCMLVSSAVSILFIVCAGTVFDFSLSFIGANLGIILAGYIGCSIMNNLLKGYTYNSFSYVMRILSPLYYAFDGIEPYNLHVIDRSVYVFNMADVIWLIRCAVYVAVFYAVSLLLYKKRKAERGGQAYAYSFIYIFCGILAGFCGGYLGGLIFSDGSADMRIGYWFGAVAGALITAVAYGAVSDRGFKTAKRSIVIGGVSILLMVVITVLAIFGMFGFTGRIPKKEKIESVQVRMLNEDITLYDSDLALKLHKGIIDNLDSVASSVGEYNGGERMYLYFDYNLKNGSTMSREFKIEKKVIEDSAFELYSSPERFESIRRDMEESKAEYFTIYINTTYFDNAYAEKYGVTTEASTVYSGEYTENVNTVINKWELKRLLEVYESEIREVGDASLLSNGESQTRIDLGSSREYRRYFDCELRLNDNFSETRLFIDSLNLTERMAEG